MQVIVDMPLENLTKFEQFLRDNQIQVDDFEKSGPAGGNPRFVLTVDRKEAMTALTDFYFG